MVNWFEQGYEGIGREEQRLATMSKPQRLWMPVGAKKELVFLENEPVDCSGFMA